MKSGLGTRQQTLCALYAFNRWSFNNASSQVVGGALPIPALRNNGATSSRRSFFILSSAVRIPRAAAANRTASAPHVRVTSQINYRHPLLLQTMVGSILPLLVIASLVGIAYGQCNCRYLSNNCDRCCRIHSVPFCSDHVQRCRL